ncbi:hypothetical protein [Leptospira kmetyi]|uniref:hypothetical protein n=1 Tax=Leptospira kmetyi TaxID=408139 RepID=UPI001083A7BB|nr:hypothetical protein [Leptospira kmetyi]TGK15918.1 hypothetical protein EHO62_09105 [Leptospira kmetyi]TGK31948.1 hypothetical protein EHO66_06085 [Leptospira kmetyi]
MKAKIIVLLIALFAVSACTTGSSSTHGNGYQYSAGSYYVIQEAKTDYVDSEKGGTGASSISKNPIRIYLDLLLFPFNLAYYTFYEETIFGTFNKSPENRNLEGESSAQQIFEFRKSLLQNDPNSELVNAEDGVQVDVYIPLRIYGDLVVAPLNLVAYYVSGDTIFGSLGQLTGSDELRLRSNRAELARDVLRTATVKKQIATSDIISNILDVTNILNAFFSLGGKGKADVGAFEMKPYFTSDRIMNRFDAETFGQLVTDANLVLDDLDLSAEDVEELKQNGYLDFVEDDAKSIPTFDAAPVKGKKK